MQGALAIKETGHEAIYIYDTLLGTRTHLHTHEAVVQRIKSCRYRSWASVTMHISYGKREKQCDLSL